MKIIRNTTSRRANVWITDDGMRHTVTAGARGRPHIVSAPDDVGAVMRSSDDEVILPAQVSLALAYRMPARAPMQKSGDSDNRKPRWTQHGNIRVGARKRRWKSHRTV